MKTYSFSFGNTKITIVNPTITVRSVLDCFGTKSCVVNIVLEVDASKFAIPLYGFTYLDTWTDVEINTFVASELIKHEVLPDPE